MKSREIFILSFTAIITLAAAGAFGAYSGGSGTAGDPYQIATKADLLALAADANDYSKCFILTTDINMQGQAFATAIIASNPVTGEDFLGTAFTGTFNGNGHKIAGFTINANGESNSYLGLFGQINSGGFVKNLGLENCSVSGGSNSWDIGGLVGCNWGGSISNCYSTGAISGDYDSDGIGGLAGENNGSISNCYSICTVNCPYDVGGMVGYNDYDGSISNCYSTGQVSGSGGVGGLVGWNDGGSVSDSFWDTQTSGQMTSDGGTGMTTAEMKTKSTFTNAGWDFTTISWYVRWDIVECQTYPFFKSGNGGGTGTPDDPYQIATKTALLAMAADKSYYDKCFILTADIDLEGQVFVNAIIIADMVRSPDWPYPLEGILFTGTFDGNGHKITHFTINGGNNDYRGFFGYIGSGGSVKNLGLENFAVSGCGGSLVGRNDGSISNCYSTGTVSDSGGGLVGRNDGSISNCYSTGTVSSGANSSSVGGLVGAINGGSISDCYSTCDVNGGSNSSSVGGLVGNVGWSCSISNCYSTGAVNGGSNSQYVGGLVGYNFLGGSIGNCYSTGTVSGNSYVGGLVGQNLNYGGISNCYSTGAVSGSTYVGGLVGANYHVGSISNCYSTGGVSGDSNVGGLVGYNNDDGGSFPSTVSGSFWDTQTSGQTTSDGGMGLTTSQMKSIAIYQNAGWGDNGWVIDDGLDYPQLGWENTGGVPILPLAPATPASIVYPPSSNSGQYTVSWSSSITATLYQLERSSNGGESWSQIYSDSGTSYSETVGNGSYRYRAKATNSGGSSGWQVGIDCVVQIPGIYGRVTDTGGNPIYSIAVYAEGSDGWGSGSTGEDGTYVIPNLPSGSYIVYAYTTPYLTQYYNLAANWDEATQVNVSAGGITSNIDFVLERGGEIRGRITDINNDTIPNIWVSVMSDSCFQYEAITDQDGTYAIGSLPSGTYRVNAYGVPYAPQYYNNADTRDQATLVKVSKGSITDNINFTLQVGGEIHGRVTDFEGNPLLNIWVNAQDSDGRTSGSATGADGIYVIVGLHSGNYWVYVTGTPYLEQFYNLAANWDQAMPVNVSLGNITENINFALERGGEIHGKVTDANGSPLANINVYAEGSGFDGWGSSSTGEDGTYIIAGLTSGTYYAHVDTGGTSYAPQYYNFVSRNNAVPLSVFACGIVNNINFVLQGGRKIQVRVLDAETGQAVQGVFVRYFSDQYTASRLGYTDGTGTFILNGLADGQAELYAMPNENSDYAGSLPYYSSWPSNWITLRAEQDVTNCVIVLHKGALVTGRIIDAIGMPAAYAFYAWQSKLSSSYGYADANGFYKIRLPIGPYSINSGTPSFPLKFLPQTGTITNIATPVQIPDITGYSSQNWGAISGNVNNPNEHDKAGVFYISAFPAGTPLDADNWYTHCTMNTVSLQTAGPFTLFNLPNNSNYDLYFYVHSGDPMGAQSFIVRGAALNVPTGTIGMNFDYDTTGTTISGTINNVRGEPILGATAILADAVNGQYMGYALTDPNGEYIIPNVPEGTYLITAVHSKYCNISTTVIIGGVPVTVNTLTMAFTGDKEAADLNGDGLVDNVDIAIFADQWLRTDSQPADLNQDSTVNFADWARVAENWLIKSFWRL